MSFLVTVFPRRATPDSSWDYKCCFWWRFSPGGQLRTRPGLISVVFVIHVFLAENRHFPYFPSWFLLFFCHQSPWQSLLLQFMMMLSGWMQQQASSSMHFLLQMILLLWNICFFHHHLFNMWTLWVISLSLGQKYDTCLFHIPLRYAYHCTVFYNANVNKCKLTWGW